MNSEIKQPGREAHHTTPSRARVKKAWNNTSFPPCIYTQWCVIKHRNNLIFSEAKRKEKGLSDGSCGHSIRFHLQQIILAALSNGQHGVGTLLSYLEAIRGSFG
jgi:hypothetical protein